MCIYRFDRDFPTGNDPHPVDRPLRYDTTAHVITQGLGQNRNTFPGGVLCDGCNAYFGKKLEPALLVHPTLAYDMQRLGVPGKDGRPRPLLANWRRASDGACEVPMAPLEQRGEHNGRPVVVILPILDPGFDQGRFRRALHMLAFNVLAYGQRGHAQGWDYDPHNPKFDAVRAYIRAPRRPNEAWPLVERYDPPREGGKVGVQLFSSDEGLMGRIRAYSFEFYVDLLNTGNLLSWVQSEGITSARLIPPGTRYPASPTMDEVPPDRRGWLRLN